MVWLRSVKSCRRSMNELAATLESGATLEEAVQIQNRRIPPHLRGLVIAGLRSGRLGDILSRFSEYVSVGTELKRRLWLNLAYPLLTVVMAMALFFFVCVILVGQFDAIYRDFNVPLPRLTIVMLSISRVVNQTWAPLLIVIGAIFCGWLAARVFLPAPVRRGLAGRLPLVGPVWRATSIAEFCHLLALLLESRLPLPEAIRLTGEGVQDSSIDSACQMMAKDVESGRSLSAAMAQRTVFPQGLPRLLRWAENDKSLSEVLQMAGAMYESRAGTNSTLVGAIMNVLCVLLVMSMVMIVPALFVPLITLISRLSG
jgi:type II secretory pathway component PulF